MARSSVAQMLGSALRAVARATVEGTRTARRSGKGRTPRSSEIRGGGVRGGAVRGAAGAPGAPVPGAGYPGDFTGTVRAHYAPDLDGEPDPGEIVWTWVPYEEDHTQGKDRPVLLVGHDGAWLLGLMLSSRDHDTRPSHRGEAWVDIGTGEWDSQRRPSEVRLDRVIRIDPESVRREGAVLDRARFDHVIGSLGGPGD